MHFSFIYLLIIFIFTFLFSFIFILVQLFIIYSEDYFILLQELISQTFEVITVWRIVSLSSLLYYLLLTAGYAITLVSIKVYITVSLIIGNIIDIYLLGIMVVLINWLLYCWFYGLILYSFILYLFLTKIEVFLIILFSLESFSSIFQSLTLSNRLSINILAGSLLISLLSIASIQFNIYIIVNSFIIFLLLIIYSFEILNSFVQLFIFILLNIEYSLVANRLMPFYLNFSQFY